MSNKISKQSDRTQTHSFTIPDRTQTISHRTRSQTEPSPRQNPNNPRQTPTSLTQNPSTQTVLYRTLTLHNTAVSPKLPLKHSCTQSVSSRTQTRTGSHRSPTIIEQNPYNLSSDAKPPYNSQTIHKSHTCTHKPTSSPPEPFLSQDLNE